MSRSAARRRRRDILFTLAGVTVLTAVMALALQGVAIIASLLAGTLFVGYTTLLIKAHKRTLGTREGPLPGAPLGPGPSRPCCCVAQRRTDDTAPRTPCRAKPRAQ